MKKIKPRRECQPFPVGSLDTLKKTYEKKYGKIGYGPRKYPFYQFLLDLMERK